MNTESHKGTSKTYRTSDLYLSAFLCASDVFLQGTEKKLDGKIIFLFLIDEDNLERQKELFYNGRGMVSAAKFVDCIRRLKGICHN